MIVHNKSDKKHRLSRQNARQAGDFFTGLEQYERESFRAWVQNLQATNDELTPSDD